MGCADRDLSGLHLRLSARAILLVGEEPEHPASVSSFALDRHEVTVGRFAAFVDAYEAGWRPSAGAGANVAVEKSPGLAAGATGWSSAWDSKLPEDRAGLDSGARGPLSGNDRQVREAPRLDRHSQGQHQKATPAGVGVTRVHVSGGSS